MKIEVVHGPTPHGSKSCQVCGAPADLTLRPPRPGSGPPPLDLCHPCSRRFLRMLEERSRMEPGDGGAVAEGRE